VPHFEEEKSSLRITLGLGVDVASPPPPITALHANAANARDATAKIILVFLFISHSPLAIKLMGGILTFNEKFHIGNRGEF
jgi:hypothetical protein